jgi:hypothetical protein
MNQLDQYLIRCTRNATRRVTRCLGRRVHEEDVSSRKHLEAMHLRRIVIKRTLLNLSDQQLVTGIAVLSVGFVQISTLTEYQ